MTPMLADILTTATPLNVFLYVTFVVKIAVAITICLALACGWTLLRMAKRTYSKPLAIYGRLALSCGLFGAAYSALNSYIGFAGDSNPHDIYDVLPSIIAAIYVLLLGVVVWLIAKWGNASTTEPP
ncbi:hypothetical protein [Asticcacaulis benevestitus]|nr:hypothetical protein [Asticcacaulis benevestitus]